MRGLKFIKIFPIAIFLIFSIGINYAKEKKKEETVKIPKEISQIFDANLPSKQERFDIPINYAKTLYFPSRENYFAYFFFKIKNGDLNFQPVVIQPEKEKKPEEQEQKEDKLVCNMNFFLRIYSIDEKGEVKKIFKEIYLPYFEEKKVEEYNPEEENFYSVGTIFQPGKYLLGLAITTVDLKKVGMIFEEFSLPSQSSLRRKITTTPLFFVKSLKRISQADTEVKIYKNLFHYSVLEIEPKFVNKFSPFDNLDIFYFILGSQPDENGKFDFEINYKIKRGEEEAVKFSPQKLDDVPAPIVSLPLPLSSSEKPLEPSDYILEITIKDKNGNISGKEEISFKVKEGVRSQHLTFDERIGCKNFKKVNVKC
ncbi:MAG: hypothetical protein AB1410_00875 [Acidobacteriota bacterium]